MSHPDEAAWSKWFNALGRRVIATRNHGHDYEETGDRDHAQILRLANLKSAPRRVLEIGCGDGRVLSWFASAGADTVGNDVCAQALAEWKKSVQAAGRRGRHDVVHGGATELASLAPASFDLIYSIFVLQHVSRRDEIATYISEATRLLAPGGVAVLQFRRSGLKTLAHQTVTDCLRLPTKMPSFDRHWRGHRFSRTALQRIVPEDPAPPSYEIVTVGMHHWLVIPGRVTGFGH